MTLRQVVFRLMLWALAFAAVGGALASLFLRGDTIGRVIGTGVLISVACAMMLPIARLVEKPDGRSAGLVGIGFIVAELMASLALVWDIPRKLGGWRITDRVAMGMFASALGGIAIASMLRLAGRRENRAAGIWGTFFATVGWGIGMAGAFVGRAPQSDRLFGTALNVGLCGLVSAVCLLGRTFPGAGIIRWIGIASIAIGGWLLERELLTHGGHGRGSFVASVYFLTIGAAVATRVLLDSIQLREGQSWLRPGAFWGAVVTGLFVDVLMTMDTYRVGSRTTTELLTRVSGASGILTCCGMLAMLVLSRMNKRVERPAVLSELRSLEVICPGCAQKQVIDVGGAVCEKCGLRMRVEIAEPRCSRCDYLLFGQRYERCPECGDPVRYDEMARMGWAGDG